MSKQTDYQKAHNPIRQIENKCDYRGPKGHMNLCPQCGADLPKSSTINRAHKPGQRGMFGWTHTYGDGSTVHVPPS